MSYSDSEHLNLVSEEIKKLVRDATICREVKNVVESRGWKETIGPIIDRMIMDVLGGKIGDTWLAGKLNRARSEEKREFYIGYKQALIEFHNRVLFHLDELRRIEETLKTMEIEKNKGPRIPMVEDTRYAP